MVKGISRQIIVVKTPDPRFFEQAIFILREDALGKTGVTDEEILREAGRVADGYARTGMKSSHRFFPQLRSVLYMLGGGLMVAMAWLLSGVL